MFCSATPTLKKRSGCRSVKARAPCSRGRRSAARSAIGRGEVDERLGERHSHPFASSSAMAACVLVVRHRQVVPLDLAFHEGDALAEHGPAQQRVRAAVARERSRRRASRRRRGRRPRRHPSRSSAAVDHAARSTARRPCSRAPAGRSRRRSPSACRAGDERRTSAFPTASPRCIRRRSPSAKDRRSEPCRRAASAAPAANDRPMPERAGREVDARELVLRMHAEQAAVGAVGVELGVSQPRPQSQRRVERQRRMALRENEPVAVGVAGIVGPKQIAVDAARMSATERQSRCDRRWRASTAR